MVALLKIKFGLVCLEADETHLCSTLEAQLGYCVLLLLAVKPCVLTIKYCAVFHCRDAQALQEKLAKKAEQAAKAAAGGK